MRAGCELRSACVGIGRKVMTIEPVPFLPDLAPPKTRYHRADMYPLRQTDIISRTMSRVILTLGETHY